MSIKRLCPKCQIYTENSDHCSNCGELINFEKIKQAEKSEQVQTRKKHKAEEDLEKVILKFKNSRFLVVRMIYRVAYSVWFVFAAIVSFFMFIIATMPG